MRARTLRVPENAGSQAEGFDLSASGKNPSGRRGPAPLPPLRALAPVESRDDAAENTLPLPPMAGGEHGQAAVYNAEIEYDTAAGEWAVTDDAFDTAASLYLANQEIWISQWGGEFYQGRGVPGETDDPPS